MARALALTPECLDCTSGGGDEAPRSGGGTGPSIITRPPSDLGSGGGASVTPGTTGATQQPVTVGTSNLPSTGGPRVIPPAPSDSATAAPAWRKFAIALALVVGALLVMPPMEKKK